MKRILSAISAALFTLILLPVGASANPVSGTTNVYRLYNPHTGDHLFTTSYAERVANACPNPGFQLEQTAFNVYTSSSANEDPIERLYNPSTGDHFYITAGSDQVDIATNAGYHDEGVAFYTRTDGGGSTLVYSMFNPTTKHHFYTTSSTEMSSAEALGYQIESHLMSVDGGASTPLYRLRNVNNGSYVFTTDSAEVNAINCVNPQYKYEGIPFSVYGSAGSGLTPVNRYLNRWGKHFLTASSTEVGPANSANYASEGVAFYIDIHASESTYRFFNYATESYMYVTDGAERTYLNGQDPAWTYQMGGGFAVDSACTTGCTNPIN